jgi:DNA invertase Pin-like site-specific DNA recombinase/Arc/MetJ-type ribon-helix-helix transcriptional regulator
LSRRRGAAPIEDQVRRCREYIESRGGFVPEENIYKDAAISGASLMRPALERMMEAVEKKQLDVVVIEDGSRLSRDIADSASLFKRLQYRNVELRGVADGINSSERSSKLTFTVKSLLSEVYIDDLRDKTLRGLEGRALAGFSTGGLPIGYASEPVVERIFHLYGDGLSHRAIAALLNQEAVPPPRANTQHRRKGWVASTIREILRNDCYIGSWSFKEKVWSKVPGTNIRRYRKRPEHEVIRQHRPELAIIDQDLWNTVRSRAASVHATYTLTPNGEPKGRASGRKNDYVLSGILICGECGASMTIAKGTSAHYYKCGDFKKRGTCKNDRSLREDVARRRLFESLMRRYREPDAIKFLRQAIVDEMTAVARDGNAELEERQNRLARTDDRIRGLVDFISRGDQSEAVRKALMDLEASAKQERAAVEALRAHASKPVQLPSPEIILETSLRLQAILEKEPLRGREALRTLFIGKGLLVKPYPDGRYMAEGQFDPLGLFRLDLSNAGDKTPKTPAFDQGLRRLLESCSSEGCAGRN